MTPRLPWLLPARLRSYATGGHIPPRTTPPEGPTAVVEPPPRPARPVQTPPVHATYVRPAPGTAWEHTRWQWEDHEAAVLHRLAEHGGDLTAHRTVHLEDL